MGRCGSLWVLCPISPHALHSRWFQARDLMLMSHLQDNIHHADPPVQVGALKGHLGSCRGSMGSYGVPKGLYGAPRGDMGAPRGP